MLWVLSEDLEARRETSAVSLLAAHQQADNTQCGIQAGSLPLHCSVQDAASRVARWQLTLMPDSKSMQARWPCRTLPVILTLRRQLPWWQTSSHRFGLPCSAQSYTHVPAEQAWAPAAAPQC